MKKVLLTGCAGFIGARTSELLLEKGHTVIGIDNMNDYYAVALKDLRISSLLKFSRFVFHRIDIEDKEALRSVIRETKPETIVNLAARAGVRASLVNPDIYIGTNVKGMLNVLELAREFGVPKVLLASTSAVYAGQEPPFNENQIVEKPISPYAASKRAAELLAYTYHHLYHIDVSILRYFTVYGPAGRPDMSPLRFTQAIYEERPFEVYGDGSQSRDFTFIDDIAEGTISAMEPLGYEIINLGGGNNPFSIKEMIQLIEESCGKKAKCSYGPFHQGDLFCTWADIAKAGRLLHWEPRVNFKEGIRRMVKWYVENRNWLKDVKF
ncbi:MAG: GDP-mannose 4,6-dehydratase [Candidatus Omnitrophota bacterium]